MLANHMGVMPVSVRTIVHTPVSPRRDSNSRPHHWHHRFYFQSRNQRRPKGSAPTLDKNAQLWAAPLCPARRVKLVHSR